MRGSERPAQLAERTRDTQWEQLMGVEVCVGGGERGDREIPAGTSLPAQPLEQVSSRLFEISCRYHSGEHLSRAVAARAGEMPVPGPGPGIGNREPASTWLNSMFSEAGGWGWAGGECPAPSADRDFPFPSPPPTRGTPAHPIPATASPPSTRACDHVDCFKNLLRCQALHIRPW